MEVKPIGFLGRLGVGNSEDSSGGTPKDFILCHWKHCHQSEMKKGMSGARLELIWRCLLDIQVEILRLLLDMQG